MLVGEPQQSLFQSAPVGRRRTQILTDAPYAIQSLFQNPQSFIDLNPGIGQIHTQQLQLNPGGSKRRPDVVVQRASGFYQSGPSLNIVRGHLLRGALRSFLVLSLLGFFTAAERRGPGRHERLAFSAYNAPGRCRDVARQQTVLIDQLFGCRRFRVGILDPDKFHR